MPNGTFLAGITRNRTVKLLRNAGVTVEERTVTTAELDDADEMFTTGNAGKVQPVSRYESRDLQPGPIGRQAHDLYMAFARTQRVIYLDAQRLGAAKVRERTSGKTTMPAR